MRIPDDFRQSVVFVGLKQDKTGRSLFKPKGTAFFVILESDKQPGTGYNYLVTAAHVAELIDGSPMACARLNSTSGEAVIAEIEPSRRWWFHPADPFADVAVLPIPIDRSVFDYRNIPSGTFADEDSMKKDGIGTGDEVAIIGLFAKMTGKSKTLPIVRMGNIAMIPPSNERISTDWIPKHSDGNRGTMEGYLIEARSIGGLSGSPVLSVKQTIEYHKQSSDFGPMPYLINKIRLLGLIHGHWDLPEDASLPTDSDEHFEDSDISNRPINMGIAIMTPTKKIIETLNRPELVEIRRNQDEMSDMENAPTPD